MQSGYLLKLIQKLAPSMKDVRKHVAAVRKQNPGITDDELADYIGDRIVWAFTGQGVALSLPGAIPGLGTVAQAATEISTVSADIALMIRNQLYLTFTLACCYGISGREVLIQDTLICMGMWTKTLQITKTGAVKVGSRVLEAQFKKKVPGKVFQAINKKVGTTIVTKYGTKRGGVAIGKLIPFGVGCLVGGGFNYLVMKKYKKSAMKHFSLKLRETA